MEMIINNLVNGRTNVMITTCDIETQTLVNTGIKSVLDSQQTERHRKESGSRLI